MTLPLSESPGLEVVLFSEFDSKLELYQERISIGSNLAMQCKKNQISRKPITEASMILHLNKMVYIIWHPLDYWSTKQYKVGH